MSKKIKILSYDLIWEGYFAVQYFIRMMVLTTDSKDALNSLIDGLMSNPQKMRNMAEDLKPLTKDDIEVAFGIFVGYVTGGFAEMFYESKKRSMTTLEILEVRKILFDRALEMKKAITFVRAQEKKC